MRLLRFRGLLFTLALAAASVVTRAQTNPVAVHVLPPQVLVAGAPGVALNLAESFGLSGVSGEIVQFDTVRGKLNAELLSADAPNTVANFLGYVNRGDYDHTVVHRSVPGSLFQAGGYRLNGFRLELVPKQAAIRNEFSRSNVRGTIAMAKPGTGPDTATSQWFINLKDNSGQLDSENGGYTVFARVLGAGITVADALSAIPAYDKSDQLGADFAHLPLLSSVLQPDSFVTINSVRPIPLYADASDAPAVLHFVADSGNPGIVSISLVGSTLSLVPVAPGAANITVHAIDTNADEAEASFTVTVVDAPIITTPPASIAVAPDGSATLTAATTGAPTYQWRRNGQTFAGATSTRLDLKDVVSSTTGLYSVVATIGSASVESLPAIVGLNSPVKIVGAADEVVSDVALSTGATYDQVLLQGVAASIVADPAQITRLSFIDLNDDIVQVEYSGPGTLSVSLEESSGPARPRKYNQGVAYVRGHASIVITGADERSNVTVYSVGRKTAANQSLFTAGVAYDGVADIAFIAIASSNGRFGSVRAGNTRFFHVHGYTGLYAPGVAFAGPVYLGDVKAFDDATPVIVIGSGADVRLTGGGLLQPNGQPVHVAGIGQLHLVAGTDSHGTALPAQQNHAALRDGERDVTSTIVVAGP